MTMLSVSLIAHGIRDLPEPVSIINLQGKILPYLYVFHAEMYAVLQCARSDDLRHRYNDSIAICTDSQAALKALASPKVTSALVAETVAALRELAIHNSVRLVWVPGHHGIPRNEAADVLAKQASAQPYIGPEPVLVVTSTTVRNTMRQLSVWEQNRLWCLTPGCRQAKSMLKGIDLSLLSMLCV